MSSAPSPSAKSAPEFLFRRERPTFRRRTLTAAGVALFLAGLLFGEAIDVASQGVEANTEAAAAVTPFELDQRALSAPSAAELYQLERSTTAFTITRVPVDPPLVSPERQAIWNRLADCESGDWKRGVPIADTRRWDSTAGFFEGGLQFHPTTWKSFKDADMPVHAYDADPLVQMLVAERVLEVQGWGAWPVCSRKVGYR